MVIFRVSVSQVQNTAAESGLSGVLQKGYLGGSFGAASDASVKGITLHYENGHPHWLLDLF